MAWTISLTPSDVTQEGCYGLDMKCSSQSHVMNSASRVLIYEDVELCEVQLDWRRGTLIPCLGGGIVHRPNSTPTWGSWVLGPVAVGGGARLGRQPDPVPC